MSKPAKLETDAEMHDEYDMSNGVRGRYAGRFPAGSKAVLIAPDLADLFPDSEKVNEALRSLAYMISAADKAAGEAEVDPEQSLITVTPDITDGVPVWHVHYGPKEYAGRLSGDLTIDVDAKDASIKRIVRGQ